MQKRLLNNSVQLFGTIVGKELLKDSKGRDFIRLTISVQGLKYIDEIPVSFFGVQKDLVEKEIKENDVVKIKGRIVMRENKNNKKYATIVGEKVIKVLKINKKI